jgi:tripartite-type tricarboxylate transporter receptor subunit TctC
MYKQLVAGIAGLAALGATSLSQAQEQWPAHPVTLVVAYAPAGMTDLVTRNLVRELGRKFGQTFIVENKPGAAGMIGAQYVAQKKPDGYTLLVGATGHVINPAVKKNMPFDPRKAFEDVAMLAVGPNLIVAHPKSGVTSFRQLADYAKQHQSIPYATAGAATATHILGEKLRADSKLPLLHVPYKGSGPAMQDVVAGQVPFGIIDSVAAASFVKTGKVNVIAVTSKNRSQMFPDVPTLEELGYPGFDETSWIGLYAPAGTPQAIIQKLNLAVLEASKAPAALDYIRSTGSEPGKLNPTDFKKFVHGEIDKWQQRVQELKIEEN